MLQTIINTSIIDIIAERASDSQRAAKVVLWPIGFVEAWGTKAQKPHIFLKSLVCWPCRLRRQRLKTIVSGKRVLLWLGTPGLKQSLGQKTTLGSL